MPLQHKGFGFFRSPYFARHTIDKQGSSWSTYGKGRQAWDGWGGDPGLSLARSIARRMDAAERRACAAHHRDNTTHADTNASHRVINTTSHCSLRREPEITSTVTTNLQKGRKQRGKNRKFSSYFDFQNQLPATPPESL